ncbi:Glyoxalase-like domain protein [Roseovarius albus]|uniref:Glyoxalase-like domain protein n=1 Tax=Roseovarius albus TaxID=1247867 RepID=A0A1X7A6E9_9RHOB|nr:VOC family protein [Roseovarius albus]SLN71502.1 Glyoxalase-like domain protein [Roseovarius albus]
MKRLAAVRLAVRDPQALAAFYTRHLGMQASSDGGTVRLGYAGEDAELVLCPGGEAYSHTRSYEYWKIGITLPNIDIAYQQLSNSGIPISPPQQFGDIGYMCHLSDPEGFVIELLQHDFEGNRPETAGDKSLPLGGGACIGQITLRCSAIEQDIERYQAQGMVLLSVQPVTQYGFTLYFLAFTTDTPPKNNLEAIENREWLWKRPYTTLELQHCPAAKITKNKNYLGLVIT